jgi:hypothetical protein
MRSTVPPSTASARRTPRAGRAARPAWRAAPAEPEPPEHRRLHLGRVVREGADRPRELAVGDCVPRRGEPPAVARQLRVPARALEPKVIDLRVDAVRAVRSSGSGGGRSACSRTAAPQAGRAPSRQGSRPRRGAGSRTAVSTTSGGREPEDGASGPVVTDLLRDRGHEGDHVVLHLGLDLAHAAPRRTAPRSRSRRAPPPGRRLAARGERVDEAPAPT